MVIMPDLTDFLSRIQTDYAFYLQFRQNPDVALAAYELSSEDRAAVTEFDPKLSHSGTLPDRKIFTTDLGWTHTDLAWIHVRQTEQSDLDLNVEVPRRRSEVEQAVVQIRGASTHTDRLAAISTLMEYIG